MENQSKKLADLHGIVGKTFGKWLVIEYVGDGKYKSRCSCGTEMNKPAFEIMRLRSTQCVRCRRKHIRSKGMSGTFGYTTKGYYGDL